MSRRKEPTMAVADVVTAKERRGKSMRRKEDREIFSQLDRIFDDCGSKVDGIIEHIDSEWETVERLKLETREILKELRPV